MKEKIKKIKKKFAENKAISKIKKKSEKTRNVLMSGQNGGILLLSLYTAQFLCGCILYLYTKVIPEPLFFVLVWIAVIVGSELASLLLKIVVGGSKRSRIYFYSAIAISIAADYKSVYTDNPLAIAIAILIPSMLDIFGRCLWGIIVKKHRKQIFGYVMMSVSFAVLAAFAFFLKYDGFGKDIKGIYIGLTPQVTKEVESFSEYIENGPLTVRYYDYGPSDSNDIQTSNFDLSGLANKKGLNSLPNKLYFKDDLTETPVAGRIWFPQYGTNCPVLFIVHGNHEFSTPSHLGYEYLGEYLASNGYVVVSVDETMLNCLSNENDARAILFLENIKAILNENDNPNSPIYQLIDKENIAVAGHSRGGECASAAYLFNEFTAYPDNGNIKFDYDFKIKSVIAIAPTVDQYMPANHAVELEDVNYLLIHGANDQDVLALMGEKQYNNIEFTEDSEEKYLKAYVYILGANHGQFNSKWGRYDSLPGFNGYFNTANHLTMEEQQTIAKAYIRVFLDTTMTEDCLYSDLLKDNTKYMASLPQTVLLSNYMDSNFENLCSFDDNIELDEGEEEEIKVFCFGMSYWYVRKNQVGNGTDKENYVLDCAWTEESKPMIDISFPAKDITDSEISFRIADMTEDKLSDAKIMKYMVQLTDSNYNMVEVETPGVIYPALAVQLYKTDVLINSYEYKHQMETVFVTPQMFKDAEDFDFSNVIKIRISLDRSDYGEVIIDDIGITKRIPRNVSEDESEEM